MYVQCSYAVIRYMLHVCANSEPVTCSVLHTTHALLTVLTCLTPSGTCCMEYKYRIGFCMWGVKKRNQFVSKILPPTLCFFPYRSHLSSKDSSVVGSGCHVWLNSLPPQVSPLLQGLSLPLFSSMVRTVWPSQCSGSPHSMMVGLQSTTPSLSVQASVQSPPVEQVFQSLYPTMWYTLSVLWPPTAMGAAVLSW